MGSKYERNVMKAIQKLYRKGITIFILPRKNMWKFCIKLFCNV